MLARTLGPKNSPFALKLKLVWVVVGDVCLIKSTVNVFKTNVTICERHFQHYGGCTVDIMFGTTFLNGTSILKQL